MPFPPESRAATEASTLIGKKLMLSCLHSQNGAPNGPANKLQLCVTTSQLSTQLAQLRTGHCGLNYYLWRFKKEDSAECMSCGYEKETVEHFLTECPSFWEERRELRKKV